MPRRFNPNTKYGRKKIRQELNYRIQNEYTDEQKREANGCSFIIGIIMLAIVIVIAFLTKTEKEFLKWLK